MNIISDILFVISNGLLIPVVLMLLFLLVKAIIMVFCFYAEWRKQKELTALLENLVENYNSGMLIENIEWGEDGKSPIVKCVRNMILYRCDRAYCYRLLENYQVDVQQLLYENRFLVKFGPMLGLMGTLIPMGPALVGLATGDITSMAYNMQVAFATTVVGMLVAGIGMATLQIRQIFYARSLNTLEFLYHKLTDNETESDTYPNR